MLNLTVVSMLRQSMVSEEVVLKVLTQTTPQYLKIWEEIDFEMKQAMSLLADELDLGRVRGSFIQLYWWYVSRKMVGAAHQAMSLVEIEQMVGEISQKVSNEDVKLPFLRNRAQRSLARINYWIEGNKVLDFGCGDGMLAKLLEKEYDVLTADVLDYRSDENTDLTFVELEQDGKIGLVDQAIDTSILWTVLHHCDDPEAVLEEVVRLTKSRIIIVEGYIDNEKIRIKNCFYDWYFNRPGKGEDVNVPYQYRTSKEWRDIFERLGWRLVHQQYLGVDEPVVPERHALYVLEPRKVKK